MARTYYHNEGYTRGGLDVVTGVNLFFKGILLFPIFVLATFVGLTMMKHVLFNGIPSMNGPTEEQREMIRARDEGRSVSQYPTLPVLPNQNEYKGYDYDGPRVVSEASSLRSNCGYTYHGDCDPTRLGANGLPYVYPTAQPLGSVVEEEVSDEWETDIDVNPFN